MHPNSPLLPSVAPRRLSAMIARLLCIGLIALLAAAATAQDETAPATAPPASPEAPAPPPQDELVRQPLGVDLLPPLSLGDAESLLNRAQLLLEGYGTGRSSDDLRLARMMTQCVLDFVQLTGQRRRSLTDYRWTYLGRERIPTQGEDVQFNIPVLDAPVPHVQAVALNITRELIQINTIEVHNTAGPPIVLHPALVLDPEFGRRHYVYLPQGAEVTSVSVTARALTWNDGNPRIRVWLLQSPREEYLLQALYHLENARTALNEDNNDASVAELEIARRLVTQAREAQAQ